MSLPETAIASRIVEHRVRVCLYCNGAPISNVLTIPAAWRSMEEDQWTFGESCGRTQCPSRWPSGTNTFCVSIEQNMTQKIELLIELCVMVRPSRTPASSGDAQTAPVAAGSESTRYDGAEMTCGWAKLEIHSANMSISSGVNRTSCASTAVAPAARRASATRTSATTTARA